MKRFLGVLFLMTTVILLGAGFKDVPVNHWAYEAVMKMAEIGVITGMPDGTFQGNSPMTRYQVALAFYRFLNYIEKTIAPKKEIEAAVNKVTTLEDLVSTALMKLQRNAEDISNLKSDFSKLQTEVAGLRST
ncbi:MAG: hypothetical protein DRP24_00710, partial [Thermotoga sp.]